MWLCAVVVAVALVSGVGGDAEETRSPQNGPLTIRNGRLYNVVSDSHDDGPVWSGIPLAVVDTYEHAYYIDFQNRKADYVVTFTKHLDWNAIERRLRACLA